MKNNLLALAGAVAGGALGYFGFLWLLKMGVYALVLPGGLLGLGAGMVTNRSILVAMACGLLALLLGMYARYSVAAGADQGFGVFLAHAHELSPVTLGLIALGGLIGFWVPFRRRVVDLPVNGGTETK